jgi:hypothetical protein
MPRDPHDIANINLRIREILRAKLEREAQRHRFSLNNEIRIRLEDSLERDATRVLDDIANDMQINWLRYSNRYMLLSLEDDLAAKLAQTKDPEVASLAKLWLQHRAQERRLTQGSVP